MFETMAPYKLGMTMTSNCPGRATSCIELCKARKFSKHRDDNAYVPYVLSTIMSLYSIPVSLYSSATRRKVFKKRPSPSFMMFALWTQVTFCNGLTRYYTVSARASRILTLRLFLSAKSNAKRQMRSALARVETFKLSTTPG